MKWFNLYVICGMFAFGCQVESLPTILTTADSGTNYKLHEVKMATDSLGFIAGGSRYEESVLLRTDDGGFSWTRMETTDLPKTLFALDIDPAGQVLACAYDGWVYQFEDVNSSGNLMHVPFWDPIHSIKIVHENLWVMVGGDGFQNGHIGYSIDQGSTWQQDSIFFELRDVEFTDDQNGVACGFGNILTTSDGAQTFQNTGTHGDFFTDLHFPTPTIGYACGFSGSLLKTTDGGNSWEKNRNGNQLIQKNYQFNHIHFYTAEHGVVVGQNGIALYTDDGGDEWKELEGLPDIHLYGVWMTSAQSGIIVGDEGYLVLFLL